MASVIIPHSCSILRFLEASLPPGRLSALRQEGTHPNLTAMLMMSITGLMPIALKRRAHERILCIRISSR